MQPLLSPAQELDDEISVSRRLRRLKRRLLLGASYPDGLLEEMSSPPASPVAVRTAANHHKRCSLNATSPSLSSLDPPLTPRSSEGDEDVSKDLSIRSDPGPYFLYMDADVSGVRKLRRIKRRLLLEQLASASSSSDIINDNNINTASSVPPHIATRSFSDNGPGAPTSPMKNPSFEGGATIHDQLLSASEIVTTTTTNDDDDADMGDTVSPLPSPRLSASRLRRIKRRLFLDQVECPSDLDDVGKASSSSFRIIDDDHGEILQKASSSSLNQAFDSWSDKVEQDRRAIKEPPQLRMRVAFPQFPDLLNHHHHQRKRSPREEMALDGLSSKLEILSLNEAMNYNNNKNNHHEKESKSALMVVSPKKERMMPKAAETSSSAAIFI